MEARVVASAHYVRICKSFRNAGLGGWDYGVRSTGFSRNTGHLGVPWQGVFRLKAVLRTELKQPNPLTS